ncbi:MAG TPA: bifunctional adenosylcobinamide kinase/adenosylcobinamide-phosphate guanylyltransferase [Pyrinomonadaceae bacterium]|nr:bifunctional adenosylcobinamide kinase/adenosylcobinamide-phosphate guanylyltransferase [Pyrinomonadaceae bacterium]
MSKTTDATGGLILILGGARAGKSSYALQLAGERELVSGSKVCFIATAQGLDKDMARRIDRHRGERPSQWLTIEAPYEIDKALRQTDARIVIVDCLTLLVSNWLLRDELECEPKLNQLIGSSISTAKARDQTIICVSNEVGLGLVPDTPTGRRYRDLLGRVNQQVAQSADEVYLLVAGLPLRLKPDQPSRSD